MIGKRRQSAHAWALVLMLHALALSGCAAKAPQPWESVNLAFDGRQWSIAYEDANEHEKLVQYLPAGQSLDDWQEMVMTRGFKGVQNTTPPPDALAADRKLIEKQCKDVQWNLIEDSPDDVVYEVIHRDCVERQPAHEIGRFLVPDAPFVEFANRDAIFRVVVPPPEHMVPERLSDQALEQVGVLGSRTKKP